MSTTLERMSAVYGSRLVTGTTAVERVFNCFSVNEDTVITEIYYTSAPTTNVLSTLGLSSNTLKAGQVFFCKSDDTFSKIKLASGSVIIH